MDPALPLFQVQGSVDISPRHNATIDRGAQFPDVVVLDPQHELPERPSATKQRAPTERVITGDLSVVASGQPPAIMGGGGSLATKEQESGDDGTSAPSPLSPGGGASVRVRLVAREGKIPEAGGGNKDGVVGKQEDLSSVGAEAGSNVQVMDEVELPGWTTGCSGGDVEGEDHDEDHRGAAASARPVDVEAPFTGISTSADAKPGAVPVRGDAPGTIIFRQPVVPNPESQLREVKRSPLWTKPQLPGAGAQLPGAASSTTNGAPAFAPFPSSSQRFLQSSERQRRVQRVLAQRKRRTYDIERILDIMGGGAGTTKIAGRAFDPDSRERDYDHPANGHYGFGFTGVRSGDGKSSRGVVEMEEIEIGDGAPAHHTGNPGEAVPITTVVSSEKPAVKKYLARNGVDFKLGANGQYEAVGQSPRNLVGTDDELVEKSRTARVLGGGG